MLTSLRSLLFGFAILLVSSVAQAAPFEAKAFQDAQAAGKTILIDVFAPWCPVCRKQRPTVEAIQKERPNLVVFEVDYDSSKDVLRRFNVMKQATLILFKGTNEIARLSYDPDPDRIRALVAKGF
jgi:thioredoxin 1